MYKNNLHFEIWNNNSKKIMAHALKKVVCGGDPYNVRLFLMHSHLFGLHFEEWQNILQFQCLFHIHERLKGKRSCIIGDGLISPCGWEAALKIICFNLKNCSQMHCLKFHSEEPFFLPKDIFLTDYNLT